MIADGFDSKMRSKQLPWNKAPEFARLSRCEDTFPSIASNCFGRAMQNMPAATHE